MGLNRNGCIVLFFYLVVFGMVFREEFVLVFSPVVAYQVSSKLSSYRTSVLLLPCFLFYFSMVACFV